MARFFRRGRSAVFYLPIVAAYTSASGTGVGNPTAPEIAAGTSLTTSINAIAGFDLSNTAIAVPDLGTTFNKSIPGEDTTQASTITFYDDDSSTTVRSALAKGTAGYILLCPYGETTTKRCELWPVRSSGVNDTWDLAADAARFVVSFAITDVPAQNSVLP
jgi:hypothetical protein